MSLENSPTPIDLSIALDIETLQVSGELIFDTRVILWLEAARKIAPKTFEIIICTKAAAVPHPAFPPEIKIVGSEDLGYYGLKSKAAQAATGEIIFFADIDCRPKADYLINLLRHFEDPNVNILGGRSYYDGKDFITRVNTVTSFGYLHQISHLAPNQTYVGHNVAIRRQAVPDPFGPYTDRYGGDEYLTCARRRAGDLLPVFQDLVIYHESPAFNWRALIDRHLREVVRNCFIRTGPAITGAEVLREARQMSRSRWGVFKKDAHKFSFTKLQRFQARLLFRIYGSIDVFCAFLMYVKPSLLQRWLRYQYGDFKNANPVSYTVGPLVRDSLA